MAAKMAEPGTDDGFEIVARDTVPALAAENSQTIPEQIDRIRSWLQPTEYSSPGNEYMKHFKAYVPNTGNWARESAAFSTWAASTEPQNARGCLHIRGVAGSGKSVFAASTVHQLQETDPAVPVLYFFFRQIVEKNHSARYLVRDFASQLLPHSASLVSDLNALSKNHGVAGCELEGLWRTLVRALEGLERVYCVIDALDEMDDEYLDFIKHFVKLGSLKPHAVKVLITSRPLPKIEEALRHPGVLQLKFDSSLIQPDVAKYVDARLQCLEPRLSKENEGLVRNAICERAQGLFIYARFVTDTVLEGLDSSHYSEVTLFNDLEKLPNTLRNVYENMLREHSRRSGISTEQQARILTCVTYSTRPLRLIELGSLVARMPGNNKNDLKRGKELARASCGRLLEILEDDSVSIIHHSFTEFLHDISRASSPGAFPVLTPEAAHGMLAIIYLEYMADCPLFPTDIDKEVGENYEEFDDPGDVTEIREKRKQQLQDVQVDHPLVDVALQNLLHHIGETKGNTENVLAALDEYIVPGKPAWGLVMMRFWTGRFCASVNRLHLAASLEFPLYCFQQFVTLAKSIDSRLVDAHDGEHRTPLSFAAQTGKSQAAKLLLECGADPKSDCRNGLTPLHYAVMGRHADVMKLLLDAGVSLLIEKTKGDIYAMSSFYYSDEGDTALKYGLRADNPDIVAGLVPYIPPGDFDSALHMVRNPINIEAILQTGKANVDSVHEGSTRLYKAAGGHEVETLKILLRHGADVNKRLPLENVENGQGPTPLHAFAGRGHKVSIYDNYKNAETNAKQCLALLLKYGANIHETASGMYGAGMTALHFAVHKGLDSYTGYITGYNSGNLFSLVMASLILDAGAEVNAMNAAQNTPLHIANPEDPNVIGLLIERGADPDVRNKAGRTPLLEMLSGLRNTKPAVRTLEVLRCHGEGCAAVDGQGNNLFHYVMRELGSFTEEHIPFFRFAMEESGNAINKCNEDGDPPILKYTFNSGNTYRPEFRIQEKLLREFVQGGLDLNMPDKTGKTILWRVLCDSSAKIQTFITFVQLGADPKIRSNDGTTLLHVAQDRGLNAEWTRLLASYGVDCLTYDANGNNLIHALLAKQVISSIKKDTLEVLTNLVEMGVSPTAKTRNGMTAINIIASVQYAGNRKRSGWLSYVLGADVFHGLDVNEANNKGIAPIHSVAGQCQENLEILLEAGADPTALTNEGLSPLHIAARERRPEIVVRLLAWYEGHGILEKHIDLCDNDRGRAPLHYACRSGQYESVWYLLRHGADAGLKDKFGITPLHVLAESRKEGDQLRSSGNDHRDEEIVDIVGLLSDAGADLGAIAELENGRIVTPMDLALQQGCWGMARELRKRQKTASSEGSAASGDVGQISIPNEDNRVPPAITSALSSGQYTAIYQYMLRDGCRLSAIGSAGGEIANRDNLDWSELDFLEHFAGLMKELELGPLLNTENDTSDSEDDIWSTEDDDFDHDTPFSQVCGRSLPGLHIIQAMVERIGLDAPTINNAYALPTQLARSAPLHKLACGISFWQVEALEYLLSQGVNTEAKTNNGSTPLVMALRSCGFWKDETVRVLLKYKADPNAILASTGQACLALSDSAALTRMLLERGAKIEDQGSIMKSSIDRNDPEMTALLIDAGIDPNYIDERAASTEWLIPESQERYEIADEVNARQGELKRYIKHQEDEMNMVRYALHNAARPVTEQNLPFSWDRRRADLVDTLLAHSANPWATYPNGDTVTHRVIRDKGMITPLLDAPGCDINCRGQNGHTLLISACIPTISPRPRVYLVDNMPYPLANTQAARLLLARNADVFLSDGNKRTALHWLLTLIERFDEAHQTAFDELIERGGEQLVRAVDVNDISPLHLALASGQLWAVWRLLTHGADASCPDPQTGDTALHHIARRLVGEKAAAAEAVALWKHLVGMGLDVNARNRTGETPALAFARVSWKGTRDPSHSKGHPYYAMRHDTTHCGALALLIDAGADLTAVDDAEGQGMLHLTAGRRIDQPNGEGRDQVKDVEDFFERLLELGIDPRLEDRALRTPVDVAVARGRKGILQIFTPQGRNRSGEKVPKRLEHSGKDDDNDKN